MLKSQSRKSAVKAADTAFSLYIRKRDKRCVCCGSTSNLQCGHLFTRAAYSTRWNPTNAACQCAGCNLKHEYDPGPLTIWFLEKFGEKAYSDLYELHHTPFKFKTYQLIELAAYYTKVAKELS